MCNNNNNHNCLFMNDKACQKTDRSKQEEVKLSIIRQNKYSSSTVS